MIRRAARAVAVVLLASVATLGLSTAPALAAGTPTPVVLVSTDGISYQPTLSVGLFNDAGLLVPGDDAGADLYIKNPLSIPATVRVNVGTVTSSSNDLAENMQLTAVDTSNGSTVTATWMDLAQCDVVVEPITIAGDSVLRVQLSLRMLNATGMVAQNQNAALEADIQMQDAAGGSFPPSSCDPAVTNPGGTDPGSTNPGTTKPSVITPASVRSAKILGYTGETFPTQLLILGGVLVGLGWFLIAAHRRRKREETQR